MTRVYFVGKLHSAKKKKKMFRDNRGTKSRPGQLTNFRFYFRLRVAHRFRRCRLLKGHQSPKWIAIVTHF